MTRVREWLRARASARHEVVRLTRIQDTRRRHATPRTLERAPLLGLQNQQARGAAEYGRTVLGVRWLITHRTERDQIEALADEISELGSTTLQSLASSPSQRKRLGDHFWCDCLAAVVVAVQEIDGLEDKLTTSAADAAAELAVIAWREVKASRETSHGIGPTSRSTSESRSTEDHRAGLSEAILEAVVRDVVKRVVAALLTWQPRLTLDEALLNLRVLTVLMCPDPAGHELVWTNCWCPLFQNAMRERLSAELARLDQVIDGGLAQPHSWDERDQH